MSTRPRTNSFGTIFNGRSVSPSDLVAAVTKFLAIGRERRILRRLDPHILKDIGYSRAEADEEAGRPSWDAPSRWLR